MSDRDDSIVDSIPVDVLLEINRLCVEFEQAWRGGHSPSIDDFVARISDNAQVHLLCELIAQEIDGRHIELDAHAVMAGLLRGIAERIPSRRRSLAGDGAGARENSFEKGCLSA